MYVRTPWWLNLLALAIAVGTCVALDLPWWAAAIGALVTGTLADRAWAAHRHRRNDHHQ
ncbi:MAG TPA: hypothetical protein VGE95_10425 [Arthrobacter sp.]